MEKRYIIVNTNGSNVLRFLLEAPEDEWDSSVDTLEQILASAEFASPQSVEAEQSPTTEPRSTTTTESAGPTVEDLAEMIVLESGFVGTDWDEAPQADSDLDYATIDGCEFVDELEEADGHLVELESPEFRQLDTFIEHDVRVYSDVETAIDVVLAWAQDPTLECTLDAARRQVEERVDRGEFAPFSSVDVDLTRIDDLVREPRVTNFEFIYTFNNSHSEAVLHVDAYFVQLGRSLSSFAVTNPGGPWGSTGQLLDVVLERMVTADNSDAL